MIRTAVSIALSFLLILGCSLYEIFYIRNTLTRIRDGAVALFQLTEENRATHEDGNAFRLLWEHEKSMLHIWLPHTAVDNFDYHLNEALGYLYQDNDEDALPKLEVIIDMTENIMRSTAVLPENIF